MCVYIKAIANCEIFLSIIFVVQPHTHTHPPTKNQKVHAAHSYLLIYFIVHYSCFFLPFYYFIIPFFFFS